MLKEILLHDTGLDFDYLLLTPREETDLIVLHHTGSPQDADFCAADIHAMHKNMGWSGIGYHFVIRKDGKIEAGRPHWTIGAHTWGENSHSIGIHLSGNFALAAPTPEQVESCAMLLAWLCELYHIRMDREHIMGHGELMATDCPGEYLMDEMGVLLGKALWYAYDAG